MSKVIHAWAENASPPHRVYPSAQAAWTPVKSQCGILVPADSAVDPEKKRSEVTCKRCKLGLAHRFDVRKDGKLKGHKVLLKKEYPVNGPLDSYENDDTWIDMDHDIDQSLTGLPDRNGRLRVTIEFIPKVG